MLSTVSAREPASFWRETDAIALSRRHSIYYERWRKCRSGGNKLSNGRSFIILPLNEGLTSLNRDNSANLSS